MSWDMRTLNVSATINVFRVLARPGLCLPHATVSTFNDLPIPLNRAFEKYGKADIRAVILDKDDCFARPHENEVYAPYREHFSLLRQHYPGSRLLIVSNTAGSVSSPSSSDPALSLAKIVSTNTGVDVLTHSVKKPGCGKEIMDYFRNTDESEGLRDIRPGQIAVVGDRLLTDMCLANDMGSWSVWVREGVVDIKNKSIFARLEHSIGTFLMRRGYEPPVPKSPFE